eukprot:36690-Prymnesium_polylepis.4
MRRCRSVWRWSRCRIGGSGATTWVHQPFAPCVTQNAQFPPREVATHARDPGVLCSIVVALASATGCRIGNSD